MDGNIHWSLKYYNAASQLARVESYYPEVVRSKTRTRDGWSIVERARSDWEKENARVVLLPSRRLPSLDEYLQGPKFFAFPTAGFNIFPGEPCSMFKANRTQIRRDDFVVDVTRSYSINVNYLVFLLGKDIDKELSTRPLNGETFRQRDTRGFPMIEFRVLINPLASSTREGAS